MKDKPMVIYCHHGMRSLHATRWLRQHGRQNVFSLAGGIQRWSDEIDPQVPTY
jgi:adenylyltransferase/sulfurtransferase